MSLKLKRSRDRGQGQAQGQGQGQAQDPEPKPPKGSIACFASLEEFAQALTDPEIGLREWLKREMFVEVGGAFYKWIGSVCPNSRDHHIVVKGPEGECYCPHCRSFIEPAWF